MSQRAFSISKISSSSGCSDRNISKSDPNELGARFEARGGWFIKSPEALAAQLAQVRALVFDWDGVFNAGVKARGSTSGFAEADSMGVNLLRYGLWRRDERIPAAAIVTGEPNESARTFAEREHFHALYRQIRDKRAALADFCQSHALETRQVACFFDDVNDIAMAAPCGVRILVRRDASVLLSDHLCSKGGCDYVTGAESGRYPVREAAELLLGLSCLFDVVIESRVAFDADYQTYLAARQEIELEVFSAADLDWKLSQNSP